MTQHFYSCPKNKQFVLNQNCTLRLPGWQSSRLLLCLPFTSASTVRCQCCMQFIVKPCPVVDCFCINIVQTKTMLLMTNFYTGGYSIFVNILLLGNHYHIKCNNYQHVALKTCATYIALFAQLIRGLLESSDRCSSSGLPLLCFIFVV